ncbi:hypothetical protein HDV00_002455 [Rhizophlyctis rosea]|nr:hypothetical protein HDV00_002455 [Rhizophlyctis rosea]
MLPAQSQSVSTTSSVSTPINAPPLTTPNPSIPIPNTTSSVSVAAATPDASIPAALGAANNTTGSDTVAVPSVTTGVVIAEVAKEGDASGGSLGTPVEGGQGASGMVEGVVGGMVGTVDVESEEGAEGTGEAEEEDLAVHLEVVVNPEGSGKGKAKEVGADDACVLADEEANDGSGFEVASGAKKRSVDEAFGEAEQEGKEKNGKRVAVGVEVDEGLSKGVVSSVSVEVGGTTTGTVAEEFGGKGVGGSVGSLTRNEMGGKKRRVDEAFGADNEEEGSDGAAEGFAGGGKEGSGAGGGYVAKEGVGAPAKIRKTEKEDED